MAFTLKVAGSEPITLGKENVTSLKFKTDIPQDSDARSTDIGSTLEIEGKIITALDGAAADDSMKLYKWSLVPAERADSYRNVTINVIAAGQNVRTITFPNAFVVHYDEHFDDETGNGRFRIILKQKKDKLSTVQINGGYPA